MDNDQAKKLRDLVSQANESSIITFLSSKEGIGKTTITTNLASLLCKTGKNTLLIDCSSGLLTTDILLNIVPKHGIKKLISQGKSIDECLVTVDDNLKVLYGKSLVEELKREDINLDVVQDQTQYIKSNFDFILIDIDTYDVNFILDIFKENVEFVFILPPKDLKCLQETYATIKYISKDTPINNIKIIINKVEGLNSANETYDRLSMVAEKFLSIDILKLGYISKSKLIPESIKSRVPAISLYEDSEIYKEFKHILSEIEKCQ